MGTLDKVKGLVENPPKEYRSAPFWGGMTGFRRRIWESR